jgi:hypothetical protein
MDRKISRPAADVIETRPITLAGVAAVVGARTARACPRRTAGDARLRDAGHQAGLGL